MTTLPTFAVHRKAPLLVGPAAPTPRDTKRLSDIDDLELIRNHVTFVFFYRPAAAGDRDPPSVIRRALGEALVPYYPLAGRMREVEGGKKLVVDCTGEGVMFVEADADVRLEEMEAAGHGLRPPFPCMEQLLFDVEGSGGVVDCPLLLIQVTRLLCGGFVFALRFNHTICDATGLAQFLSAVADHARGGLQAPTVVVAPPWSRHLLKARTPPKPTFPHPEFHYVPVPPPPPPPGDMVTRTFTFGQADVTAIKKKCLRRTNAATTTTTSLEALTAAIWRARTAALELPPDQEVRLVVIVNLRKLPELALPAGYYGNATVASIVMTTAGALLAGSLGDAVELVRKAKAQVTAEYARSTIDFVVLGGQGYLKVGDDVFGVSDLRHVGISRVDFGWGEPVYAGITDDKFVVSHIIAVKDGAGEDAVAVPVVLPRPAMDRFASEVETLLKSD